MYDYFGSKDSCMRRVRLAWTGRGGKTRDPLISTKIKKRKREKKEMLLSREAIAKRKEKGRDFDRDTKEVARNEQQKEEELPLSKKEKKGFTTFAHRSTKFANWRRRVKLIHNKQKDGSLSVWWENRNRNNNNTTIGSFASIRRTRRIPSVTPSRPSNHVYWHQNVFYCEEISKRIKGVKADKMTVLAKKEADTIRSINDENKLYEHLMQLATKEDFLFVKTVLSNLSLASLTSIMQLIESKADANFDWDYYTKLFGSDVANSALLRDIFRRRRQLLSSRPYSPSSPSDLNIKITADTNNTTGKSNLWKKYDFGNEDACEHPILTTTDPTSPPKYSLPLVPTFELFQICFSVFSNNIFRNVHTKDWYVAGGSVLACLMPLPADILRQACRQIRRTLSKSLPIHVVDNILELSNYNFKSLTRPLMQYYQKEHPFFGSDIDITFQLSDLSLAPSRFEEMYNDIKSGTRYPAGYKLYLSKNTVTIETVTRRRRCNIKFHTENRNIQFVLPVLRNIEEQLQFADLDCTACAYDGKQVVCVPRFVRAVNYRSNLVSPLLIQHPFEQIRVVKYIARGFAAQIFELCKHFPRCDVKVEPSVRKTINAMLQTSDSLWLSVFSKQTLDTLPEDKIYVDTHTLNRDMFNMFHETNSPYYEEIFKNLSTTSWDGVRWKWEDIFWKTGRYYLPKCYVCREPFYPEQLSDMLCSECNNREHEKWNQWDTVDLSGRTALVTGARIKIGYQCAKRLLRSGCTVIALTRFPNDAMKKYTQEPDYEKWKDKLHVYGLDLRHLPSVMMFIQHVAQYYPVLDIIINNAAQTIRRPLAYFYSLIQYEKQSLHSGVIKLVGSDPLKLIDSANNNKQLIPVHNNFVSSQVVSFTDVALVPEDSIIRNDELFPPGQVDAHNEQLDLRKETTWVNNIEQVSVVEALEVQTINSTVPFMLISQLTPALKAAAAKNGSSYVINVTSAEGDFNFQWRKDTHPHTNMAKASLNMMTKSIAGGFALDKIFVNAVDTGWVSLMNPSLNGTAPLTETNGAMRVLDPIFTGLTQLPIPYGQLFRNYQSTKWV